MKVLKFGGTSVGTVKSLSNVRSIIESLDGPAVVVVSALGGLTDKLIATAGKAQKGDVDYRNDMESIITRHAEIIDEMIPEACRKEVEETVGGFLSELSDVYDGVYLTRDLSERTLDKIVSFGERMSSVIVSRMLPGIKHLNSLEYIKTERWFNKNIADNKLTDSLIKQYFSTLGSGIAVVGGFISTDRDSGEITNLGRGGSDFTAALIAAALDADELQIWTDVDGFMTSDPRIIASAKVLDHMTFVESMELCTYGAKVIYPPTIYPVFHKNIPIKILNTFNPQAPGTLIDDIAADEYRGVRGLSALRDTSLFTISGAMTRNVAELNSRAFNAMAKNGVSLHLVTPPSEESFSFAVSGKEAQRALKGLEDEFGPEIISGDGVVSIKSRYNLATIAVVGEHINEEPGLPARISNTLERNGIEVFAKSDASSATTICLVVEAGVADDALRLLHSSFIDRD